MHNIIGQKCKYQIRINEKLSLIPIKKKESKYVSQNSGIVLKISPTMKY